MKSFTLNIKGAYTRLEVPPRCRKPRPVTHAAQVQVEVRAVTAAEAPVAFRVNDWSEDENEIRTFAGRLFAPYRPTARQDEPTRPGDESFPQNVDFTRTYYGAELDSEEAFKRAIEDFYASFLIIDGIVWEEVSEPFYVVTTFGMGNNHGGTALMVNGNGGTVFRADEFDEALAHAIETAEDRGDTKNVHNFKTDPEQYRAIDVLIPDAVTLVTVPPAPKEVRHLRWDYDEARRNLYKAESPDEETRAFAQVSMLREQIAALGHTPVAVSNYTPYEARKLAL